MQTIIIFLLFAAALGYLGWRVFGRFSAKETGCGKGCGCAPDERKVARRVG
ncbi:FeoB-associated Cys-rich membrane protein [Fibrella aquatica]|jgi:FeoB-associated Cys-rich membrane protein|uniref:FeoB-associated Cys-rich membrane protein n=1 Tax=Fibrella aquatica TaxID=3242487 RepID=UPI003521F6DD